MLVFEDSGCDCRVGLNLHNFSLARLHARGFNVDKATAAEIFGASSEVVSGGWLKDEYAGWKLERAESE